MPDYDSFAAAVQGEAARWNIPGVAAAVLHNGERTVTATGLTSLDHPVPVAPETRFQIGSISKTFTATAVMTLVDEGVLDLDAPVTTRSHAASPASTRCVPGHDRARSSPIATWGSVLSDASSSWRRATFTKIS